MSTSFKKTLTYGASGLVILSLILIPKFACNKKDNIALQPKGLRKLEVNVMVAKYSDFENTIKATGTILSNEGVDLAPETAGKITGIFFNEGSVVAKGTLLVKINDAELQAQYKRLNLKKGLAADKEYRYRVLFNSNNVSKEEYDIVLNDLRSIEADCEMVEAQIAKTEIRAPFDGIIGLRNVSVGAYLTTSTKIASIQSIDPIKIEFSIPQQYSNQIKLHSKIKFEIPSQANDYIGEVYAVEPKIDQNSRTLKIRATSPNPGRKLQPGAYVDVRLTLDKIPNAVMIPSDALVPDIQGEIVYLFSDGKAVVRKVKSATRTERDVQIIEGLNSGDSVITSGIIQLKPGLPVNLSKSN